MRIYAIRHGESVTNRSRVFAGWMQAPLSEEGRRMARELRPRIAGLEFSLVYASDLIRALETADLALPEAEPIRDARLREVDVGSLAGQRVEDAQREFGKMLSECRRKGDYTPFGGESTVIQAARVRSFFEELSRDENAVSAAVFCHEGTIQCLFNIALGTDVPKPMIGLDNCSVSVFDIFSDRPWKLIRWNYTGTL